jgi:hypothetical protein
MTTFFVFLSLSLRQFHHERRRRQQCYHCSCCQCCPSIFISQIDFCIPYFNELFHDRDVTIICCIMGMNQEEVAMSQKPCSKRYPINYRLRYLLEGLLVLSYQRNLLLKRNVLETFPTLACANSNKTWGGFVGPFLP